MKTVEELLNTHSDKTPEQLASMIIDDIGLRYKHGNICRTCIVSAYINHNLETPEQFYTVGYDAVSSRNKQGYRTGHAGHLPPNWERLRAAFDSRKAFVTRFFDKE